MEREPRVSAIITAYNGAAYVADAIESILAQSRRVDEIVVIDDGSTDNTSDIVARYEPYGVRCIRQENRGLPSARNRGIRETSGELIAFLDCDDVWLKEKNALQVAYLLAHPDVALVAGHVWWWDPIADKRWLGRLGTNASRVRRELLVDNCVGNASGVLLRRSVLERSGTFDPSEVWAEDWELWMRIAAHGKIGFIDRPLIVYRVVPTGLTHQRRADRVEGYFQLSRRAIERYCPRAWRPLVLARALSRREMGRAMIAVDQGVPRRVYLRHAAAAVLLYPFEQFRFKMKLLLRAALGPAAVRLKWIAAALTHRMGRFSNSATRPRVPPA